MAIRDESSSLAVFLGYLAVAALGRGHLCRMTEEERAAGASECSVFSVLCILSVNDCHSESQVSSGSSAFRWNLKILFPFFCGA